MPSSSGDDVLPASLFSRSANSASDASNRARRMASIALKPACRNQPRRGLAGTPSRGHCSQRKQRHRAKTPQQDRSRREGE